jgi:hypothetical protein
LVALWILWALVAQVVTCFESAPTQARGAA